MNTPLIKIFSLLIIFIMTFCNAQDNVIMAQIKFGPTDMRLMSTQSFLDEGLGLSDVAESLEKYHRTQAYTQSPEEFRQNPDSYFARRLAALENLLHRLNEANISGSALVNLRKQAESKRLYILALPSIQNPFCTKPEALDLLPQAKLISMREYFYMEALDPLHRFGMEIQKYRWMASSIPNYFIYLDTVENDELLNKFASEPFQVKYFYTEEMREPHRLHFIDGLAYSYDGQLFDSSPFEACHSGEGFAIFVIGEDLRFYVNHHMKEHLHHSSEFAGEPIVGAGEVSAVAGKIRVISNKSGHYQPSDKDMLETLRCLKNEIGSLQDIEAHLYVRTPYSFFNVRYDAAEFLKTEGRCLPLPSADYSPIEIAVDQNLMEHADEAFAGTIIDENAGRTFPLHIAAHMGNPFWINFLLSRSLPVDSTDIHGCTPLEIAAGGGHLEALQLLYEATTDEKIRDKAYFSAAKSGNIQAIKFFLEQHYSLAKKDEEGRTLFHFAAMASNSDILHYLLDSPIATSVYTPDASGTTPLHCAASAGTVDTLRLLTGLGFDPITQNLNGDSALHFAAAQGTSTSAAYLLDIAPDALFSLKNNQGAIPLHLGASHLPADLFKKFLEKTGNPDVLDYQGETPLFYCLKERTSNAKKNFCILAENGADLRIVNSEGYTLFHKAASEDHVSLPIALTYYNGLQDSTPGGNTPLHIAFLTGKISNIYYLLQYAAPDSILTRNAEGYHILDLAARLDDATILEYVLHLVNDLESNDKQS